MTEYTSWDNYVKEQKDRILSGMPVKFNIDGKTIAQRNKSNTEWDRIVSLLDRVKDLEQENKAFQDWKEHNWPNVEKLVELNDKVKDLEEWKQDWKNKQVTNYWTKQSINIDMKVWEDIKKEVTDLDRYGWSNVEHVQSLRAVIKKADPTWCPND